MALLNEAGADLAATALAQATVSAPPPIAARLIRLLASLRSPYALPIIRQLMTEQKPAENVIAASLSFFGNAVIRKTFRWSGSILHTNVVHPRAGRDGVGKDRAGRRRGALDWSFGRYLLVGSLPGRGGVVETPVHDRGENGRASGYLATIESQEVITPFLTKLCATKTASALPAA